MSAQDLIYLKYKNHSTALSGSLIQLLNNSSNEVAYDDATIFCDGKLYPVHRFVLSISSTYFAQMFSATSRSGRYPIIVLKDVPQDIFEILLKYIYLGEVKIERCKFGSFIHVAQSLQINGLSNIEEVAHNATSSEDTFAQLKNDNNSSSDTPRSTPSIAGDVNEPRVLRKRGRPRKEVLQTQDDKISEPASLFLSEGELPKKIKIGTRSSCMPEAEARTESLHSLDKLQDSVDKIEAAQNSFTYAKIQINPHVILPEKAPFIENQSSNTLNSEHLTQNNHVIQAQVQAVPATRSWHNAGEASHQNSSLQSPSVSANSGFSSLNFQSNQEGTAFDSPALPVILEYHSLYPPNTHSDTLVDSSANNTAAAVSEAVTENSQSQILGVSQELEQHGRIGCRNIDSTESNEASMNDIVIKTEVPDEYSSCELKQCNVILSPLGKLIKPEPDVSDDEISKLGNDAASEQIYKCSLCTFKSFSKDALYHHVQSHSGEPSVSEDKKESSGETENSASFYCHFCGNLCSNRDELETHIANHHPDADAQKKNENQISKHSAAFAIRRRIAKSITSYSCQLCSFSSPDKYSLSVHGLIHKGGKGFQCADCSYSTIHKHSLISHRRIHTGEKPFRCMYCDYSSRQKGSILYHQRRRHSRSKLFRCTNCQFRTGRKVDYDEHMTVYHPNGEGPFQCPSCPSVLATKADYIQHMESHFPTDKILRCPTCCYSTRNKNTYHLHILRHRNRKRLKLGMKNSLGSAVEEDDEDPADSLIQMVNGLYRCTFCPFKTPHKGVLTVHIRRHTGEKPYACHLCEYKSAQAGNLDAHLKNHEIKKNFFCPHCSYSAGYEANLERHIKRDHISLNPDAANRSEDSKNDDDVEQRELLFGAADESADGPKSYPSDHMLSALEGFADPLSAMCQVQLEEQNEEMDFVDDTNRAASSSSSSHHFNLPFVFQPEKTSLTPPRKRMRFRSKLIQPSTTGNFITPPPLKIKDDRNPYVTTINGISRCNECFYSTRNDEEMDAHQQHHTEEKRCICMYCDYRCIRNQHLQRHIQKYKGGPTIKCKTCSYHTCVLNARHRKMCAFFNDLYSRNPDVRIDNSLAIVSGGGVAGSHYSDMPCSFNFSDPSIFNIPTHSEQVNITFSPPIMEDGNSILGAQFDDDGDNQSNMNTSNSGASMGNYSSTSMLEDEDDDGILVSNVGSEASTSVCNNDVSGEMTEESGQENSRVGSGPASEGSQVHNSVAQKPAHEDTPPLTDNEVDSMQKTDSLASPNDSKLDTSIETNKPSTQMIDSCIPNNESKDCNEIKENSGNEGIASADNKQSSAGKMIDCSGEGDVECNVDASSADDPLATDTTSNSLPATSDN